MSYISNAILLSSLLVICSCSYIKYSTMGDEGRMNELRMVSAKIVKAVSWSEFMEVAPKTTISSRDKILRDLSTAYRERKIKDVKETELDFGDDFKTAYQVIQVQSFSAPTYAVESEIFQFEWVYDASDEGWKIDKLTFGK